MLLVSPLINFTDQKEPAFCFCGVEFQSIQSILEVHTRINAARGRKMLRRSREWLRPPNSSSRIVLLAMGLALELAKSTVRFSLGEFTTAQEIDTAVRIILQIIQRTHARHIAQTEHVAI